MPISDKKPIYGLWPRHTESRLLEKHNLGYLRLPGMDEKAVADIREWMPRFSDTKGLIVDVRGNGGGSREALIELAGWLMDSTDAPHVANACKYRLYDEFREDHLSRARFVYRASSEQFGEREKAAISKFMETFQPEWQPPTEEFSEWHYLVLSKSADDPRDHYDKPVVILLSLIHI